MLWGGGPKGGWVSWGGGVQICCSRFTTFLPSWPIRSVQHVNICPDRSGHAVLNHLWQQSLTQFQGNLFYSFLLHNPKFTADQLCVSIFSWARSYIVMTNTIVLLLLVCASYKWWYDWLWGVFLCVIMSHVCWSPVRICLVVLHPPRPDEQAPLSVLLDTKIDQVKWPLNLAVTSVPSEITLLKLKVLKIW